VLDLIENFRVYFGETPGHSLLFVHKIHFYRSVLIV
jgi:hypothetical protein